MCAEQMWQLGSYIFELHQSKFPELRDTRIGCFWLEEDLAQAHLLAAE